jgi:NAD(P)H-nitrite reductase large subunit
MSDTAPSLKSYNILPGPKMGLITPEYLESVAAAVRKHEIPLLKITSAQRLAIGGHGPEAVADIWRVLGFPDGPKRPVGVHYIQACPGSRGCKYGQLDSLELGRKLDKAVMDAALPAKTKFGLSGCVMNCCESYIRDVGLFGKKNGWTLIFVSVSTTPSSTSGRLCAITVLLINPMKEDQEWLQEVDGYQKLKRLNFGVNMSSIGARVE